MDCGPWSTLSRLQWHVRTRLPSRAGRVRGDISNPQITIGKRTEQEGSAVESTAEIQNAINKGLPRHSRGTHQQMGRSQAGSYLEGEGLRQKEKLKCPAGDGERRAVRTRRGDPGRPQLHGVIVELEASLAYVWPHLKATARRREC